MKRFFAPNTYKEMKKDSLHLDKDLNQGTEIILKCDPSKSILDLANTDFKSDEDFKNVIKEATRAHNDPTRKDLNKSLMEYLAEKFNEAYPDYNLIDAFYHEDNEAKLPSNASDKAVIAYIENKINEQIQKIIDICNNRVNGLGTGGITFSRSPVEYAIYVSTPGTSSSEKIINILEKSGQLSFYKVIEDEKKIKKVYQTFSPELQSIISLNGYNFICKTEDIQEVRRILASEEVKNSLPRGTKVTAEKEPTRGSAYYAIWVIASTPLIDGDIIYDAQAKFERGKVVVNIELNTSAARKWSDITKESVKKKKLIGILLKGVVTEGLRHDVLLSVAGVNVHIGNGKFIIQSNYMEMEEAEDISRVLRSGVPPMEFNVASSNTTGPTIGEAAQAQAFYSFILVLLLLILFMFFYYGTAGLVANVSILFNIFFILGALANINAALSLPGIAGILLTLGMSVDANVLIFERIREELKRGVHPSAAVSQGYSRAYSSIIDGNLTTLFIGIILYYLGQGPIKGFATTLA